MKSILNRMYHCGVIIIIIIHFLKLVLLPL